jgi:hypothetical protein
MTLEKYADATFPLHGGVATMIAKLLVYVLGDGLKTEDGFSLEDSRWFRNLCHLMVSDANITAQPRQVFDRLYPDIIYDAVILGLSICSTHLDIDVGDDTERRGYAEEVRDAFAPQHKMNISYVYLPLVMAGITLNQRVRLREEPVSGNISQVKEAVQGRKALSGDTYNEIFELTEQIIQHAEKSLKAD